MAISPATDLILDVVRAADPVARQNAAARLDRAATAGAATNGDGFREVLESSRPATPPAEEPSTVAKRTAVPASKTAEEVAKDAFVNFEAMTLASMIEQAMPEDTDSVFGSGTAGGIWKSMLAEQIGQQMARAGGIGIADQLAESPWLAEAISKGPQASAETLLKTQAERGLLAELSDSGNG